MVLFGVEHLEGEPLAPDGPRVADLAAGLAVERGPIEDEGHGAAAIGLGRLGQAVLLQDADDAGLVVRRRVTDELAAGAVFLLQGIERAGGEDVGRLARPARDGGVLLHLLLEPGSVHPQVPVGRQALHDLDRDAVGRVQVEGIPPRDRVRPRRGRLVEDVAEQPQAVLEVAEELLLLLLDGRLDAPDALFQFGVGSSHHLGHDRDDLVQERLAAPHLVGVEHREAEQPADDVALLLGPGTDVLVDAEGQGPAVVGHPADPDAVGMLAVVFHAQGLGHRGDDRPEVVGLEHGGDPLEARRRPLQAHAGVDVLLGQRDQLARPGAVELGEDQVPDLDFLGPGAVVEDLRARSADAIGSVCRSPGRPEVVVLAHPCDPVGGDLDLVVPDVERLVVVEINRDRQAIGGDLQGAPQELPGPVDRLALEVIAEAEVPQHLEESLVERGLTDVLDIPGAQAFLAGRRAREAGLAQPHELPLELVHAGRREQHGGIVRHQHVAGTPNAALGDEEIQERFTQLVGFHGVFDWDRVLP